jgi:hypothetical protein
LHKASGCLLSCEEFSNLRQLFFVHQRQMRLIKEQVCKEVAFSLCIGNLDHAKNGKKAQKLS